MTDSEKIIFTKALTGNDAKATDALVTAFLTKAESVILRRLYGVYGEVPVDAEVPGIYEVMQCELASRYFFRMGGEGETAHNENGVNRTYHSTNDEEILREIIPYGRVLG